MTLTHADRVKAVVKWLKTILGKTQVEIAEMCGYPNVAYFSMLLNGRKPIAASLDEKLAALHPSLNIEFLRGASDEMFVTGAGEVAPPVEPSAPDPEKDPREARKPEGLFVPVELVQMFADLSATVRSQQELIQALVAKEGREG